MNENTSDFEQIIQLVGKTAIKHYLQKRPVTTTENNTILLPFTCGYLFSITIVPWCIFWGRCFSSLT